jgi:hypothetical protein
MPSTETLTALLNEYRAFATEFQDKKQWDIIAELILKVQALERRLEGPRGF